MMQFVSLAEKNDKNARDIFEAIDLGEGSREYFKEKCNEFPVNTLILLRDKRPGNEGRTLLHNAARNGFLSAALHLLRAGHEVEPIDSRLSRITPLMDAIAYKNIEIAIILVEAGAKLDTVDVNGENSLHYAARSGSSRLVKWIVKASSLSKEEIQSCASATSIKLKFPEDLAKNYLVKEILMNLRQYGQHLSSSNNSSSNRKRKDPKGP
jgi:ankyrin repeat protein